ncbi:MAG: sulfurtransferase TusA family protein [Alphaproteobacteria bacterium]|nr:sulfurtransferase TusA family protein [Alphaproteobacteria bacterium]MBL7099761.1 sulfurtransferase TusA family protein [Alphaproteobacteria bacterium]
MPEPLDLRGLKCPLPALMTRRALARAPIGLEIEVTADDPMAAVDIPHMCHQEGLTVVSQAKEGQVIRLVIRR